MTTKTSLTFKQKETLFTEFKRRKQQNEDTSQEALARWCKHTFSLPRTPHQSTISRILSTHERAPVSRTSLINKRDRTGKHHTLEAALFSWVCHQYALRRNITGAMIRSQAANLMNAVNDRLPQTARMAMKFSGGWLTRFQDRWGLKSANVKSDGAGRDANGAPARGDLSSVKAAIIDYELNDVWNAAEFGLFYNMAPSKTIARKQLSAKKDKPHISCLACCNATGTEKFPLMFIGSVSNPHCFHGKTARALGYHYHNNHNAWMTASLFCEWLEKFDKYIRSTPDRKAILLINDSSAHGTKETVPKLEAVEVIFLSPDPVSHVLPMGGGVIPSMKVHYRKRQMERVIDLVECEAKEIYMLDQLTAMQWITDIWNDTAVEMIENCWSASGLIDVERPAGSENVDMVDLGEEKKEIQKLVQQMVGSRDRMGVDAFLNPENEDLCTEQVTDEGMVDAVVASLSETEPTAGGATEKSEESVTLPSLKEQLRAVAIAKLVVDSGYQNDKSLFKDLENVQRDLRAKAQEQESVQSDTRIDRFFDTD